MTSKVIIGLVAAAVAGSTVAAAPASAQNYYGRDDYQDRYQDNVDRNDQGGYEQRRYEQDTPYREYRQRPAYRYYQSNRDTQYAQGYEQQRRYYGARGQAAYAYRDDYPRQDNYYPSQRCKSGTFGSILGAVAGGLVGREIGRGGEYNQPSTTGLILGAGALAGRAIERGGNDCR